MFPTKVSAASREIASALRDANRSFARAIDLIATADVQVETGLSTELFLTLEAGCTGTEARAVVKAAATLRIMPLTRAAFVMGRLSWSQVRAIVASVRFVDPAGRAVIDVVVHEHAWCDDADLLLTRVDDEVAALRADLARAREDRAIETSFLTVQSRLDGGATFYGEADAESAATILEALDDAADRPVNADQGDARTRAQQLFGGWLSMCEASLNGGHTGRPRPRVLATVDVSTLANEGRNDGARILLSLAGPAPKLTPLGTETMLCDATVVPVVFDGSRPIAVGDATSPISSKLRAALAARDLGCRFPGCPAPAAWTDAHHIRPRSDDGPTEIGNLLSLCRRCHRQVHKFRWRIAMTDDGTIEFDRRGRTYRSAPRR